MSDWSPQVVKILKIEPHPNADRLVVATVLGDYPVVTNMVNIKVGDLIGYIPIDTVVPDTEFFYFLCPIIREEYTENSQTLTRIHPKYEVGKIPEKYRIIKSKNIRGVYSQGMLIPLETPYSEGESLVEVLNLKKWEEPEEDNIPKVRVKTFTKVFTKPVSLSPPQGWVIPYYDIESIRKHHKFFSGGEEIILTEKLHGSNAAYCHDGKDLWVKSRNYYKIRDSKDMWWDIAIRFSLEEKLALYKNLVFFGEIYGQVKGFPYDAEKLLPRIRFFDIFSTKDSNYLSYDEKIAIFKDLDLPIVPVLYRGPWLTKEAMYAYAEGHSTLNNEHIREGWVLNICKELDPRIQFKLVGEGYNLHK